MIFSSYDVIQKNDLNTEIVSATTSTKHLFIQTWVPDYLMRSIRNGVNYNYSIFEWDKIIDFALSSTSIYKCYGAHTNTHLDGLLFLELNTLVKIGFIATAPWNYSSTGKMRRIGSGLIYYTIRSSEDFGEDGKFTLNALPDAENFYKGIGMVATGKKNKVGLNEYTMEKEKALLFKEQFEKYIIEV